MWFIEEIKSLPLSSPSLDLTINTSEISFQHIKGRTQQFKHGISCFFIHVTKTCTCLVLQQIYSRAIVYQLPYSGEAAVHDTLTLGPTTKGTNISPFLY